MIKTLLLLTNFLGLLLLGLFTSEDVKIENNLPSTMAPGSRKIVELTINKDQIQGFSKLELTLPFGFNITPVDIKGASFTFTAQKAKFVWMTLPTEPNFIITYYLESADNMEGNYNISGVFSYVKENKRVDTTLPSKAVFVNKTLEPTKEEIAQAMPRVKIEPELVELVCERTIKKMSDTEYIVQLQIRNNTIKDFGKILETVPNNCKTEKINDLGAVVTQDKNTIKFVWFEFPQASSFEISYKILCLSPTIQPVIKGQLSYVENGTPVNLEVIQLATESQELAITTPESSKNQTQTTSPAKINESKEYVAETQGKETQSATTKAPVNETQSTVNPAKPEVNKEASIASNNTKTTESKVATNTNKTQKSETVVADNKTNKPLITNVPSAETGIVYKVQILAAHRVVNKSYMKEKFKFEDQFNIENHEGWIKYTTGKFGEYKEARDARERITQNHANLPGPFVTAYNNGERVTVQEALLISKQQWYK